jgi:DNA-binding Lrp family transcriptional regulator
MKEFELKLISELMKNSRRSDRDLAKAIGSSQPTVTRNRHRLEQQGIIKQYTMMPDLSKLGIEILAFTYAKWSPQALKIHPKKERIEKVNKFISKHPNVFFGSSGRGLGMERMMISVHKNYADYDDFMKQLESEWAGLLERQDSFIISLKTDIVLTSSLFRNLMEYITNGEAPKTKRVRSIGRPPVP